MIAPKISPKRQRGNLQPALAYAAGYYPLLQKEWDATAVPRTGFAESESSMLYGPKWRWQGKAGKSRGSMQDICRGGEYGDESWIICATRCGLARGRGIALADKWLFAVPGLCDNHVCGERPLILIDWDRNAFSGVLPQCCYLVFRYAHCS
jgi:hypothetical protein